MFQFTAKPTHDGRAATAMVVMVGQSIYQDGVLRAWNLNPDGSREERRYEIGDAVASALTEQGPRTDSGSDHIKQVRERLAQLRKKGLKSKSFDLLPPFGRKPRPSKVE